jgi:hypothetical protein
MKKILYFYGTICHVCKSEEKLLERLDQAILGVIHRSQQTTAIGTFF